jgi:hypothetical protein
MAMFVHLTPEKRVPLIRRNGINRLRRGTAGHPGGIFAVPVNRDFYVSHQWLRELKRRGARRISAVYFRIPDDEAVYIGHYGQAHRWLTASEAVAEFNAAESRLGWEVVVPRRISAKEIHRVRVLRQITGWRNDPTAKGAPPKCLCKWCLGGTINAGKIRRRFGSEESGTIG